MNDAEIPENAAGTTTRIVVCSRVEPTAKRAFAKSVRHGVQRVFRQGRDERQNHDAHDDAGPERVEAGEARDELLQQRRHEEQREVAVDDRRDAGEHLENGLDDAAHAGGANSLR